MKVLAMCGDLVSTGHFYPRLTSATFLFKLSDSGVRCLVHSLVHWFLY